MYSHGLYRAKTLLENEWVTGYYVYCSGKHFIKNGDDLQKGWHEVDAKTLGMYSGLNDVSGQMIFDGDLLEYRFFDYYRNLTFIDHYILHYPKKRYGFVIQDVIFYLNPKSKTAYRIPHKAKEMKIVGNIIDHPDLPKKLASCERLHEDNQLG